MTTPERISLNDFVQLYNIEIQFIDKLTHYGLLTIENEGNISYITYEQIPVVERYMRWHYDMDINMEGIEVIDRLLEEIRELKKENKRLNSEIHYHRTIFQIEEE